MRNKLLPTALAGCGLFILNGEETVRPEVYTAAQAALGRAAFQHSCEKCHTETLVGRDSDKEEVPEYVKKMGGKVPPLTGPKFLAKWGPQTTKDLYIRIKGIQVEAPAEDINIVAYIMQFNGAPPGTQPLTTDTAVRIGSIATHP